MGIFRRETRAEELGKQREEVQRASRDQINAWKAARRPGNPAWTKRNRRLARRYGTTRGAA